MKVVALAGGVGGAKLVDGLASQLAPADLSVVVNSGDDFDFLGLKICPDLDTVCYTLAGIANPLTGWGRLDETWNALESLAGLGGPGWFRLGDKDLGLHLERSRRLREGQTLSQVTQAFLQAWGVEQVVLPMSDDPIPTIVLSSEGELGFQEYFVQRQCEPRVTGFQFRGCEGALPAPGVLEKMNLADLVVFCPSNPWVSLDPILAVPGIRQAVSQKAVVAVSPIIGGQTIKGPAARMFSDLGIQPSALAVARHYQPLLSGFVLDQADGSLLQAVEDDGVAALTTDTIMRTRADRYRLAGEVLEFAVRSLSAKTT